MKKAPEILTCQAFEEVLLTANAQRPNLPCFSRSKTVPLAEAGCRDDGTRFRVAPLRMPVFLQKLPRGFYNRDTTRVARELLGKYLVHKRDGINRIGKIVEVEAYLGPHDLAAHSARGRTKRTEIMFGPPGHAYVYMIYGMYFCMNVVTEEEGHASAVLLRALEPVLNVTHKTSGPGLLCHAMGIDKRLNGHDLESNDFFIAAGDGQHNYAFVARPRVGVEYAGQWAKKPLRFYIKNNCFVSRK